MHSRNAAVAEWLLSLVAPPEQAAVITGDFVEQAESRGSGWFWWSVMATCVALPGRDVMVRPREMVGLGLRGVLYLFLWQLAFLIPCLIAIAIVHNCFKGSALDWTVYFGSAVSVVAAQFLVGRTLARRSPARELSVWMALAVGTAMNSLVIVWQVSGWIVIPACLACFALYQIPALTGVVLVRRGGIRHA